MTVLLVVACGEPPDEVTADQPNPPVDASATDRGNADAPVGDGAQQEVDAGCPQPETSCNGACTSLDTDSTNCGSCGHDCLGSGCVDGMCEPTDLGPVSQAVLRGLVVDATHVYWVEGYDSSLWRTAKDGSGPPEAIVPPGMMYAIRGPALDGPYVYFADMICCNYGGRVWRVARDGVGSPELLGMWGPSGGPSMAIAVDATSVYVGAIPLGELYAFPKDGGPHVVLGSTPGVQSVAVDDTYAYYAAASPDGVMPAGVGKVPKDGSGPVTSILSIPLPDQAFAAAVSTDYMFFGTMDLYGGPVTGGLFRVHKATDAIADVAVGDGVSDVTADDSGIAWTEFEFPASVWVADLDGANAIERARGFKNVEAVAVDDSFVYWITLSDMFTPGRLYRVAR